VTVVLAACAIVAALVALVARRLEHMAVALGVVGGVLAVDLVGRGAIAAAVGLIAGSALLVVIVLVATALVEVDARPVRRLQPWKLLLLVPLLLIGARSGDHWIVSSLATSPRAVAGAVILVGLLGLAAPLVVRRRHGGLVGGGS
jgi:hypothetical protein